MAFAALGKLGQLATDAARHRFVCVGTVRWTVYIAADTVVPQITLARACFVITKRIVTSFFTFNATLFVFFSNKKHKYDYKI